MGSSAVSFEMFMPFQDWTALTTACANGQEDVVNRLIAYRANVNLADEVRLNLVNKQLMCA